MSWEWLLGLAPFLLLLACPLLMWGMMRGMMSGDGCKGNSGETADSADSALQREVEALRARVADLEGSSVPGRR
jgi:hypothetical protein